jgi:hypothetical protein
MTIRFVDQTERILMKCARAVEVMTGNSGRVQAAGDLVPAACERGTADGIGYCPTETDVNPIVVCPLVSVTRTVTV